MPQTVPVDAAPRASAAAEKRFYRPELDVLRFFAFFCVFVCHGPSPNGGPHSYAWHDRAVRVFLISSQAGAFGLCIFFLLSAYLITELLLRECGRTGTISLKSFYVRRILRIWPLYYLGVAIGVAIGFLAPALYWLDTKHILYLVFFFGWLGAGTLHSPIALLWSISIEEQFYFIWPGLTKFGGRRAVLWASSLIIPAALGTAMWRPSGWYNPIVQFLFFALGALLAIGLRGRSFSLRAPARIALFLAALPAWFVAAVYIGGFHGRMTAWDACLSYSLIAFGCVVIFLSIFGIAENYLPNPLIYLGKISYGLYVFHLCCFACIESMAQSVLVTHPVLRMTLVYVFSFALSVAVAAISYKVFEQPFLRLKERFTIVPSRPA
jgi:peptidoglycan/LPS O-acetylase OafA/YrhL